MAEPIVFMAEGGLMNINIETDEFAFNLHTSLTDVSEIRNKVNAILTAVLGADVLPYTVYLADPVVPTERIKMIKAVRTVTRLGLREAKDIVDLIGNGARIKLPILVPAEEVEPVKAELSPWFRTVEFIKV